MNLEDVISATKTYCCLECGKGTSVCPVALAEVDIDEAIKSAPGLGVSRMLNPSSRILNLEFLTLLIWPSSRSWQDEYLL